jgi:lipopolysaccharide/colanic/teichoic acid biosynthesis glycosyltransferase
VIALKSSTVGVFLWIAELLFGDLFIYPSRYQRNDEVLKKIAYMLQQPLSLRWGSFYIYLRDLRIFTAIIIYLRETMQFASPDLTSTDGDGHSWSSTLLGSPHPSASSMFKRFIDIVGSLVGLMLLGILFIPIAIAIKLDSPGSVLYSQERYGLLGKPFKVYKFRSMVNNADELKAQIKNEAKGLIFKNQNDPRVTRVGRILRKTSLDEFPQFWNVLKGEMSLVGTRPPTSDEVTRYQDHHWQRLTVKPGMTGEWQVNGRSLIQDFEDIVHLDLRYQAQWHPLYDLVLILKTVQVLISKTGAF